MHCSLKHIETSGMELLLLSVSLLLTLDLSLSLKLIHSKSEKPHANPKSRLPPGHTGWPVLGETLEFLSAGRKGNPEKFCRDRMARYSPDVFKTSLIGGKTAVFCGPSGNKFLFSNHNKLVTSWWPATVEKIFPTSHSLQSSTTQETNKLRQLSLGISKPDSLKKFVGIMDSVARTHLETYWDDPCKKGDAITVLPLVKKYIFAVGCRLFLSIDDPKIIAKFEKPFELLFSGIFSFPVNFPGTPMNRAIKAANLIRKELLEIIRQRKDSLQNAAEEKRCDILEHMLSLSDENGKFMSELEIADKIISLLLGAHDSSTATITSIIKYLSELPEIYHKVLEEQRGVAEGKGPGEVLNWEDLQKMKYSWNVACEALRLAPPLQGNFREAITDFTYAGFFIPKGWKMYWSVNTTHKNPEYFPEPEKFDPSRFDDKNGVTPYAYVPFGGGPRMCPGKEFARIEILAFIHNVVRRFRWEKVIANEKVTVDHVLVPANGLPLRIYHN